MEYKLKRFINAISVLRIANIFYYEFTSKFEEPSNSHAYRELVYIDNGFLNIESKNYKGILTQNQLIIHQANEPHRHLCPKDKSSDIIIIGFESNNHELDIFSCSPVVLTEYQKRLLAEVVKEGKNTFLPPYDSSGDKDQKKRKEIPFGSDQLIKIKLENLFIDLVRCDKSNLIKQENLNLTNDRIQEVYNYINENYRAKISLSELCFIFGTNKTSLCNKFHKVYGETIISYINKKKIQEAKKLLRNTDLNLSEISSSVGFSSVYYFSRIFKQYENQSPSNYIKKIKSRLMIQS